MLVFLTGPRVPVVVKRCPGDWVHVQAVLGGVAEIPLAEALRLSAQFVVGDVGVDGDRCVVRAKLPLATLSDEIISTLAEHALAVRRAVRRGRAKHPYAALYAS